MTAMKKWLIRVLGEQWCDKFEFDMQPVMGERDYFELENSKGYVKIVASNMLAAVAGVNWYMKHYLKGQITWEAKQLDFPEVWPKIEGTVRKQTPYQYRYYLNYCTYGYSMAFWDWERWEQELDWMALNGVNLTLSLVGHEEVWRQTLIELGYTNEEAKGFICGPAFLPWQWMQNIEGWGSGSTDEWFSRRVALGRRIHKRMRELGITPALQGYSGMIPKNFKERRQDAETLDQGQWCDLNRPDLLIPGTKVFEEVSAIFYRKQQEVFGEVSHCYCTDPFHEGGNREGIDLKTCIKHIQQTMCRHDEQAIWVIQAWGGNPDDAALEVLDPSHSLILDLWCEANPTWNKRKAFGGIPWIWCILGNFGGKNGLYGNLEETANGHIRANQNKESDQMVGIGMTMEGIETNPIVWDLLCDTVWQDRPIETCEWLKSYAERRYGGRSIDAEYAWELLSQSIYACTRMQEGGVESIFCARPAWEIQSVSTWGPKTYYYAIGIVQEACKSLWHAHQQLPQSEGYCYDLVDITRQGLADQGRIQYHRMMQTFHVQDLETFKIESSRFLEMMDLMERLLGCHEAFLLGKYLETAKSLATHSDEMHYLEWNARTLITLWADKKGSDKLRDYSHRQWSGLTGGLYKKRWETFIREGIQALEEKRAMQPIDWYSMEYHWTISQQSYPIIPSGDLLAVVKEILDHYF
ncbi:MAG: alpha-N-acetylglucosaminidase [Cellulosilyticaceae bacterium]